MGYIPKKSGSGTWLNVRSGALSKKIGENQYEEHGGYSGIIRGIRVHEGEFKGRPTHELHLKVFDPKTGEEVIISSTLVGPEGSIGTWAAMCISRLANPANKVSKDMHLDIGAYQWDEKNCCSVRTHGQTEAWKGTRTRLGRDQLFSAVTWLQDNVYGQWDDVPEQPAAAPPVDEPPPPEPPYDDSNRAVDESLPF